MTLREIHARWLARHQEDPDIPGCCAGCLLDWPCPDYTDAKSAIAELDASKRTFGKIEGRIVSDPASTEVPA